MARRQELKELKEVQPQLQPENVALLFAFCCSAGSDPETKQPPSPPPLMPLSEDDKIDMLRSENPTLSTLEIREALQAADGDMAGVRASWPSLPLS